MLMYQIASKRKKAGKEEWDKQQRHKSFDSTASPVKTSPSRTASSGEMNASIPPGSPFLERQVVVQTFIGVGI